MKSKETTLLKRKEKKFAQLQDACDKYGYDLITRKDDYVDCNMEVQYICPTHGVQKAIMENLIRGHKCIECSYEERFDSVRHTPEYIEENINKINGNVLINPYEYKNSSTRNLKIRCNCGNIFTTSFNNYIRAGVNKCSSCSKRESKNENVIRKILETYNINFISEKRFSECKDKKALPFDFYLPEYNLIIEYDGEGHYLERFYNNKSNNPRKSLEKTQRHDEIKNNFCKSFGIELLRIPYWDRDNLEKIIINKINSIKNIA